MSISIENDNKTLSEDSMREPKIFQAIIKRNGMIVPFSKDRIREALFNSFKDAKRDIDSLDVINDINVLVDTVTTIAKQSTSNENSISVEDVQNITENQLMINGFHDVAKEYILYRSKIENDKDHKIAKMVIYRRDLTTKVKFNALKISRAIEMCFRAQLVIKSESPPNIIEAVNLITNRVIDSLILSFNNGTKIHVELIQDEIERWLMIEGFHEAAKAYIEYRVRRAVVREQEKLTTLPEPVESDDNVIFNIIRIDGSTYQLKESQIREQIAYACKDFTTITTVEDLLKDTISTLYDGMKELEVDQALLMTSRTKIEQEPDFAYITGRFLLNKIYRETIKTNPENIDFQSTYKSYLKLTISNGVEAKRINPKMLNFDFDKLSEALDPKRDFKFAYLGLQTLYDRYFIRIKEDIIETPQIFWMRVAMGLSLLENNKEDFAISLYNIFSNFLFSSSTPTLFNAGTIHSQLSSCYLSTVSDDLKNIFKTISDNALLSKWSGGLGNDWTNIRSTGATIKGTNGKSQGVIPFLKVAGDTAIAVNQGGKRKGALCVYLECWHLDYEDFLELRKNTGDDRRRTPDMNTASWIPDLFMKRVLSEGSWTLFSPDETPDLHSLYGKAFEARYKEYEEMADLGLIKNYKKVEALRIWRKMIGMLFETGHPWMTFKDPSNIRSPQNHVGVVHCSNLCTEILLNTSEEETAVCNLGSVNLLAHLKEDNSIDKDLLAITIKTAIRALDNVIDLNFYPTEDAKRANSRHRAIGLGIMGFQDALYKKGISYASQDAVDFADEIMEIISYNAILASSLLAKEKGSYSTFKGSKWDLGLLPQDTLELLEKERGANFLSYDDSSLLDWTPVRESIKKYGMRNSNVMAIAPTATIANILGVSASIEPTYKNLFVKSNLSGEFTVVNTFLINELKKLNLWNQETLDDIKYFDGSILEIEYIPENIKNMFLTSFEIEPEWIIECAARRQKWIDMGQSLNIYISEANGRKIHNTYVLAWKKGLKTTYYLRAMGATQVEKSSIDINKRGLQPRWMKNSSASSRVLVNRQPTVCSLEEGCESCQ